jgi:hypothetical protein
MPLVSPSFTRAKRGRPKKGFLQSGLSSMGLGRSPTSPRTQIEDELVVARQEIDSLYDDLYVLACAVDDTERELKAGKPTVTSLKEAMEWILDAARPLRDRTLTPSSQPE